MTGLRSLLRPAPCATLRGGCRRDGPARLTKATQARDDRAVREPGRLAIRYLTGEDARGVSHGALRGMRDGLAQALPTRGAARFYRAGDACARAAVEVWA